MSLAAFDPRRARGNVILCAGLYLGTRLISWRVPRTHDGNFVSPFTTDHKLSIVHGYELGDSLRPRHNNFCVQGANVAFAERHCTSDTTSS